MSTGRAVAEVPRSGWLEQMPAGWSEVHLRWLAKLYAGGTPDKSNEAFWTDGTIPWINSGAVNQGLITEASAYISQAGYDGSSARWVPKGALVMALAGQGKTKGTVAEMGIDATCNQSMAAIVPNGVNARYLFYWLTANYRRIRSGASDDLRDGLNLQMLGDIPCPVPSQRSDQERIANFLDQQTARIDALIAEKEALIARLQEWRQAWLSAELFQEAKYRETRLKFCLRGSLQYGATESGDPSAAGPRYIRITDIRMDGTLTDEDAKYLTEEQATSYLLEDEDVLFARSGATVGKSFVYLKEMGRCAYAGYLIRAKLDKTLLLPRYLRLLTETHQYWAYLRGAETQSTIQNASAEKYANFAFPLPPVSVQKEVVDRLDVQLNKVEHLVSHAIAHTKRLSEYRSSLISAAVTGQLDLSAFKAAA